MNLYILEVIEGIASTSQSLFVTSTYDCEIWNLNCNLHRHKKPAIIEVLNSKITYSYFMNGYFRGNHYKMNLYILDIDEYYEAWSRDGCLYRESDPAISYNDGEKEWHIG